mgnify:CR=1 FL=1|jgi:hypothetical protein
MSLQLEEHSIVTTFKGQTIKLYKNIIQLGATVTQDFDYRFKGLRRSQDACVFWR